MSSDLLEPMEVHQDRAPSAEPLVEEKQEQALFSILSDKIRKVAGVILAFVLRADDGL